MRTTATALLALIAGTANADFLITEIYVGLSGEDGTKDWFEITNVGGDGDLDTGGLFYDDEFPNGLEAGQLDSFVLADGESAVFLVADDLADVTDDANFSNVITEFEAVWGSIANVGLTNGGGGLSQDGDAINISEDNAVTFSTTVAFDGSFANSGATIDNVSGLTDSVVGVNGAFESNAFFNDNDPFGLGGEQVTLVGSPGQVPAPASAALFGLAALAAGRRR